MRGSCFGVYVPREIGSFEFDRLVERNARLFFPSRTVYRARNRQVCLNRRATDVVLAGAFFFRTFCVTKLSFSSTMMH